MITRSTPCAKPRATGARRSPLLEAGYRDRTGIASLKIRHNGVLGYHVEVPAKHADTLMLPDSGFTHRQTLAGVVRFNSADLHEAASRVTQAGVHAVAAEAAHLESLTEAATARREAIAASCDVLARIDVAAALADHAMSHNWCRPDLADTPCLDVVGGRHPVVEAALAKAGERFVPNDLSLSETDRLWLVTGPNMGGKSTFLRQNALIVVLAQAGGFVPAASAKLGLVDKLFSRVGASDNLARGRSTFMVEMVETAAILAQATPQSFVILDEVGRGTSTYDGLALAWSVVEAVHEVNRCRCLFATHYHELTRLAETLDALSLHHVRAREWQGDLVLLHELADGPADRSYGLAVARLAGVPARRRQARRSGARQTRSRARENRRPRRGARRSAAVRRHPRRRACREAGRAARRAGPDRPRRACPARGARRALCAQTPAGGRGMSDIFDKLEQRRAIIDRRALADRLDAIAAETPGRRRAPPRDGRAAQDGARQRTRRDRTAAARAPLVGPPRRQRHRLPDRPDRPPQPRLHRRSPLSLGQ